MPLRKAIKPIVIGLPRLGDVIGIAEVFDRAAQRILEVPEVCGGDRMPARSDLGCPTLARERHPAAEDLMHVAHLERDVMEIGFAGPAPHEEEVVMLAALRPPQEDPCAARVAI